MITLVLDLTNEFAESFGRQVEGLHDYLADRLVNPKLEEAEADEASQTLVVLGMIRSQLREHNINCRLLEENEIRERGRKIAQFKKRGNHA